MPPPEPPPGEPTSNRPLVLVVDDEEPIRVLLERDLTNRGFDVVAVPSATHAFGKLLDLPRVDCVVSDQRMRGATGVYLLDYVATEWPQCGRVIHTGYPDDVESFFAHSVVAKPATLDEIDQAIRNEIRLRRRASPSRPTA